MFFVFFGLCVETLEPRLCIFGGKGWRKFLHSIWWHLCTHLFSFKIVWHCGFYAIHLYVFTQGLKMFACVHGNFKGIPYLIHGFLKSLCKQTHFNFKIEKHHLNSLSIISNNSVATRSFNQIHSKFSIFFGVMNPCAFDFVVVVVVCLSSMISQSNEMKGVEFIRSNQFHK